MKCSMISIDIKENSSIQQECANPRGSLSQSQKPFLGAWYKFISANICQPKIYCKV